MKTKIFLISLLTFGSFILNAQVENSRTHRNLFLSTCCGEFSLLEATKSSMTDTISCERWDYQTSSFSPYNMTVNHYDVKGRMTESLSGYYYPNGTFKYISRYEFTYFPFDSLMNETHYYWNDTMNVTGAWDNSRLYEYTYDLTLKLIETQSWYSPVGTKTWQNSTREYFTYGSNNLIDNVMTEYWNTKVNGWWYYLRHRFIYDLNDNIITKYYDYSNNASGTWSNSSRFVYDYAKNRKEEIQQVYSDPIWRNSNRNTHRLNSYGLIEETMREMWNTQYNDWDTSFAEKHLYYYNNSGQLEEHIYMSSYILWFNVSREIYTYDANGKLIEKNEYDWNHSADMWDHKIRCQYISTPITLSFSTNEAVEFNIYPNPVIDYLNIVPGDELLDDIHVSVVNSTGQIMKQVYSKTSDKIMLNFTGFSHGIYFVNIEIGGKTSVVKKVLVQ